MKKADKSEAEAAIIIGQQEIEEGTLTVRPLRTVELKSLAICRSWKTSSKALKSHSN